METILIRVKMKKNMLIIGGLILIALIVLVMAVDFTPQGNINLRGVYNITGAPYVNATLYYGNGSQLTNIAVTETDPYWALNYSRFLAHINWSVASNGTLMFASNWNATNTSYYLVSNPFGFYNSTNPQTETDPLAYNGTLAYLSDILGFSYYNSTDFSIGDYYLKNNPFGYYNSTDFSILDYYLKSNPFLFWNDTHATFNKTYADTLYSTISEPIWTANYSAYNDSWSSTYNSTYNTWAYNQTIPAMTYADATFITQANEGNLNVNQSDWWITYDAASDLNNLITLDWANITNKFITAVDESYINMVGTTATFNETVLNATGDTRYINVDGETANITTTGNVTASYFIGDGSQLHGIQHGSLVLYLINNASDISGSKIAFTQHYEASATTLSKGITVTNTEYQNWTTNDGVPNLHMLLDGVNEIHLHARVTGSSKDTTLFWRLWQNNTAGNMVLLFTSEESSILTTELSAIDIHMNVDETDLNLSDRLTFQLVANIEGGGANPTVEVKIEGDTVSRVEIVVPGANVGTFVPYLGAIKGLNLGAFNFTTSGSYLGDGSFLSGIVTSESDPYWTANQSSYFTSAEILGFSYYNATDFSISDYSTTSTILGWNYWNDTYATFNKTYADTIYFSDIANFTGTLTNTKYCIYTTGTGIVCNSEVGGTETDPKWTANYTLYNDTWSAGGLEWSDVDNSTFAYIDEPLWTANWTAYNDTWTSTYNSTYNTWAYNQTTPALDRIKLYSYYNATDFDISDYFTSAEILGFSYYNSTSFTELDPKWTANYTAYNDSWTTTDSEIWALAGNGTLEFDLGNAAGLYAALSDVSLFLESLIDDTSPELGGYLDTSGENIGSTSDEIENIYVGDTTRIYFGDGQDSSIYYNGTTLIISG